MKKSIMFLTLCVPVIVLGQTNKIPPDIKSFISNSENCQHFAGEWDVSLSSQQKSDINSNIDKYCSKAHSQHANLNKKYKKNKEMMAIIKKTIKENDAVSSYE
ncbi:hypothetical protein HNQ50_002189 [Silvimonas terrae]|uniref:Uncharacterized protein n=1 Tax=Silvimonas terrae TaxID=300266 RepID=A0A840RDA8_9NEIS|nr:hypothetical protein [Silvimonas terrae]MBB5191459.1 hypothetical protein [Silvimonas terrae]